MATPTTIEISDPHRALRRYRPGIIALVRRMLRDGQARGELSLAYVTDAEIRRLNRRYRGRNRATDVLAFPLADDTGPKVIGQVVVSFETARREARERKIPVRREIALYTIHGVLHLLGFDDQSPEQTATMRAKEDHYLTKLEA